MFKQLICLFIVIICGCTTKNQSLDKPPKVIEVVSSTFALDGETVYLKIRANDGRVYQYGSESNLIKTSYYCFIKDQNNNMLFEQTKINSNLFIDYLERTIKEQTNDSKDSLISFYARCFYHFDLGERKPLFF